MNSGHVGKIAWDLYKMPFIDFWMNKCKNPIDKKDYVFLSKNAGRHDGTYWRHNEIARCLLTCVLQL